MPEELHEYIIEEIIADLFLLEQHQDGKSKVERAHSYREKLVSAIQKKKTEVASSNLRTIKKAKMQVLSKKDQQRVAMNESEPVNKLYPLNMRDNDTKS